MAFYTFKVDQNGALDGLPDGAIQVYNGSVVSGCLWTADHTVVAATTLTQIDLSYRVGDMDLHVYDSLGNHVGLNYTTGEFETEIPGVTYVGNGVGNHETMLLPVTPGEVYTISVVGMYTDGDEQFVMTANDVPPRAAVVGASPGTVGGFVDLLHSNSGDLSFGISELGGQNDYTTLAPTASGLVFGTFVIPGGQVHFNAVTTTDPRGTTLWITASVDIPAGTELGVYTGTIHLGAGIPDVPFVVSVTKSNETPTAQDVSVTMAADATATVTLVGSDAETLAENLQYAIIGLPAHGTLTPLGDNVFRYEAGAGYTGLDTFTYTVTDDGSPAG